MGAKDLNGRYQLANKKMEMRQTAYLKLFKHQLSKNSISEIREATNKAWVLGNID